MAEFEGFIRGVTDEAKTVDSLDFSAIPHTVADLSLGFLKGVVSFAPSADGTLGYQVHNVRMGRTPSIVEFRPPLTDAAKAALEGHFGAQIVYEASEEAAVV
ncbi:MAG: hypothetical protein WAQ24_01855 [Candidatus Saccharimonadales bacterium]